MSAITLQLLAFRAMTLLIVAGVHGGVVSAAAVLLGDRGPRYDGRLSPWPGRHIDLVGAASLVLFGLGWTKHVAIDSEQFRSGRLGLFLVVLAGFLGLLGVAALLDALILPALTTLSHSTGLATAAFLRAASSLTIWFALFNLIPIPPLTGGLLLPALGIRIPKAARWIFVSILLVAIATGTVRSLLGPAHAVLCSLVLGS